MPDSPMDPEPLDAKEIEPLSTSFKKVFGGLFAVAVGGGLIIPAMTPSRCMGSTRSTRLIWEERDAEIERVIQQGESNASGGGEQTAVEGTETAPTGQGDEP